MRKLGLSIAASIFAFGMSVPASAHPGDGPHDRDHQQLEDQHDDAHDGLEQMHDDAHAAGLDPWEHRQLHRYLNWQHEREHRQLEWQHRRQHRRNRDWYGGWDNYRDYDRRGNYGY